MRFWPDESSVPSRASMTERRSSMAFWRAWWRGNGAGGAAPGGGGAERGGVIRSGFALVSPAVEHVAAAVLRPAPLAMLGAARLFLAEADRFDLGLGRPHQHEHALDAFGSALPERDIVFAAAALVAVALDEHLLAAVLGEILAVGLEQRAVLRSDVVLVVLVENRALRPIRERIALRRGRLDRSRRNRRRGREPRSHAGLRGFGFFDGRAGATVEQGQGQSGKQCLLHDDLLLSAQCSPKSRPQRSIRCGL